MNNVSIEVDSERSRIRAALVNSGRYTFSEAERKLADSKVSLFLGDDAAETPAGQAAFITAAVTAARCFGEVAVHGCLETPVLLPLPLGAESLAEAAIVLGAHTTGSPTPGRSVLIGSVLDPGDGWSVQAYWDGWTAGVGPGRKPVAIGRGDCALAGVAAGGLAIGQAFLAEQGDLRAGRSAHVLSLWSPEGAQDNAHQLGPILSDIHLPTALWLVGLGNLGQAYLWSLTHLPYPRSEDVVLFFQDDQQVGMENWGTSVLVERGRYGVLKTRIAEEWATARGFQVRRIDRRLDDRLRRSDSEPGIAMAGLDGMPARRLLGHTGFEYVIDAGLGATVSDYRKFRINVFDSAGDPANHFRGVEDQTEQVAQELMKLPAYQDLTRTRGDSGCGAAILAHRSVAVPFVSAVVGALAVSQAIRIASGEAHHLGITADLGDLRTARAALGQPPKRLTVASVRATSWCPRKGQVRGDLANELCDNCS
jgi:hypothetical protein